MTRECVGHIMCDRHLGDPLESEVRVNVKGKLYIACPLCGLDAAAAEPRQQWLRANYYQHIEEAPAANDAEIEQEAVEPVPVKRKKGFLSL